MIFLVFDTQEECDKFVELYEEYKKIVYFTIKRFVNDEYIVEDISQEVYILIGKHLDKINLDERQRTKNYIITIARNYCKNYLRNHNKEKEELYDEMPLSYTESDQVLDYIINKEKMQQLIMEISNLDDIYRIVLELKYITEFSDDEIAECLKIKKKTVQMRLYRARMQLRERLMDS
mgnify:CR=1 FL=1